MIDAEVGERVVRVDRERLRGRRGGERNGEGEGSGKRFQHGDTSGEMRHEDVARAAYQAAAMGMLAAASA